MYLLVWVFFFFPSYDELSSSSENTERSEVPDFSEADFRSQTSEKLSPGSIFQIFQMEVMQTEKNVHFKVKRDYCNETSVQKMHKLCFLDEAF